MLNFQSKVSVLAKYRYFVIIIFKMLKMEIRVYKINKERVTHVSQFISVNVKKIVRKYQDQFEAQAK